MAILESAETKSSSSSEYSLPKRQISQDEFLKFGKKLKFQVTETRSFSDVLKDSNVVVVIDGAKGIEALLALIRERWKRL